MAKSRIAELYVQLVPAMEGFFSKFNRDLASNMPGAGSSAGKVFGGSFGGSMEKVLSFAKVGAGLAATLASVSSAFIAKGGITRSLNIEDAEAKLKGLKYNAAEIAKISESAMAAVNGTSYSFDAAMTIAASSLASGIQAGDELTKYLKLVGDGATVSGASLNEMGYIFNKIQGSGVAMAEELNMMADRGLPIFSWLAKEAGMSVAELRKEISKGTISAEMFRKAVEVNIGGAATSAAATTRGMAANFQSALARLGAAQYGGILPIIKNTLKETIPIIDAMTKASKAPAEEFWKRAQERFNPAFETFAAGIVARINGGQGILPSMDKLNAAGAASLLWMGDMAGKVKAIPFGAMFADASTKAQDFFSKVAASPVGQIFQSAVVDAKDFLTNLKPLSTIWQENIMPGLMTFWGTAQPILEQVGTNLQALFSALAPVIGALFAQIGPLLGQIGSALMQVYGTMQSSFVPLLIGFVASIGGVILELLPQIIGFASMLIGIIGPLFEQFVPMLAQAMTQIFSVVGQIIGALLPVVSQLLPIIGNIIQAILPVVMTLAQVIFEVVGNLLTTLGPAISSLLAIVGAIAIAIGTALTPIIKELAPVFGELIKVLEPIGKLLGSIIELVLSIAGPVLGVLFAVIIAVLPYIIEGVKFLVTVLTKAINLIVVVFATVANVIIGLWNLIVDALNSSKIEVPKWVQDLTGFGPTIGFSLQKVQFAEVPKLHTGGNVQGTKDGTPAIFGDGYRPETVSDLGLTNSTLAETRALVRSVASGNVGEPGGNTYVQLEVHPSPGMNEKDLADAAYKLFRRNQRRV